MTTFTRAPISSSELQRLSLLPEYLGSKLEVWDSQIHVLKPLPAEAALKSLLLRLLRERYKAAPVGYILQDAQIALPGDAHILRPALSIVGCQQQERFSWDHPLQVMPCCVVEIAARQEAMEHLHEKASYYAQHGCALPIMILPVEHVVEVLTPGGLRYLSERDVIDGGKMLPGFRLPVWRLFAQP
jgi:Uma2 family endonuclease